MSVLDSRQEMTGRRIFHLFALLLALCATVGVTTAAVSPAHFHAGCDVCTSAHMPVLQPPLTAALLAPPVVFSDVVTPSLTGFSESHAATNPSRGP
ncbi:MAG: hypothetical protein M3Z09_14245 [Acidobacteriota bacterium]|nr:hypothetical protein [Acidobacteriota bacterium]